MKHLVIPDCQVKDGHSTLYLQKLGRYIAEKQPEVIVCLGDFADMESLNLYDVGKKSFEGRRYSKDIEAAHVAMYNLMCPLLELQRTQQKNKKKVYQPKLVMLLGNHEERINRAIQNDPKLDGVLGIKDLNYENWGWEVHPYLDVVVIDGVAYSHFFTTGVLGRPCSSAATQLSKKHMSCISGHQQGLQIATGHRADGARLTSIIAGSCYEHNEDYLGPQGNKHWRGFLVLHEVHDGEFDLMPVSLDYLNKKYA